MDILSEEYSALCIAIETGLIPPTDSAEYDVTKFKKFWEQYLSEREKIRKHEVNQMIVHEKERYTTALLFLGSAFIGLLLWFLWYIAP